jgi:L-threonylcarbamoyladenylate synthase
MNVHACACMSIGIGRFPGRFSSVVAGVGILHLMLIATARAFAKQSRFVVVPAPTSSSSIISSIISSSISSSAAMVPQPTPTRPVDPNAIRAKMVTDVTACGARLRNGDLVAFPTETVYGLGCHALDGSAVQKVFGAKERPLTDPLIVHVLTADEAFALWHADYGRNKPGSRGTRPTTTTVGTILDTLCRTFWPGPLTLVAPANRSVVPEAIMAGTGYCAIRSPSHALARDLLRAAQVPLAAPSANKFGHVSPTHAQHVWEDLKYEDVWILCNETDFSNHNDAKSCCCDVGVESTVAKLEVMAGEANNNNEPGSRSYILSVLRQGAVSIQDLQSALAGLPVQVQAIHRATADQVANVAPGQGIRHYSPNIPSYLLSQTLIQDWSSRDSSSTIITTADDRVLLSRAVVIDYGARLVQWQSEACAYRDLSPTGDSAEAAQNVFETLRWAEQVPQVDRILFPDLCATEDALLLAVKDRLTRAASGVVLDSLTAAGKRANEL